MKTCRHCNSRFSSSHYCSAASRNIDYYDDSNFLLSAIIACETDNAFLGAAVGGNIAGAIVGEMIADTIASSDSGW